MGDSSRSRHGNITDDHEDNEWRRDRYCQPRNSVLSLVSEFVIKCTAKLQEINKKDRQEKSLELLDLKCSFKLVDIAHSLIKMASYDQVCLAILLFALFALCTQFMIKKSYDQILSSKKDVSPDYTTFEYRT